MTPSRQRNINKPADWLTYRYPFLYGQFDPTLFPVADWRDCSRRALGALEVQGWAPDLIDGDDPLLIEQLRSRVLPRRGIWAGADEIMVTIGAQQALFLLAELLVHPASRVGIEDPGYPDARNILALRTPHLLPCAVDGGGLVVDDALDACDLVYTTPSHQCPTGATMPLDRREALLRRAAERDLVLIEDDYEVETAAAGDPTPALRSLDRSGRVIYVGSLSKVLAPGLRLGFIVAAPAVIREARALRRLMLRHPPANNQRVAALFLSMGYHEALTVRLHQILAERARVLRAALARQLPDLACSPAAGGSSIWVEGPPGFDADRLAAAAKAIGILIEPGAIFSAGHQATRHCFRLGFSSIPAERIGDGIELLAALIRDHTKISSNII
jgi:GntR family transcriptional regulator/MocR family aminotransferase